MGVCQADTAIRCLADMANDVQALYRVRPHQFSDFRFAAGQRVMKGPTSPAFVEGNTPAVAVRACPPTALNEPRETKPDVRRDVAVHAQQLTHDRDFSRAAGEGKRSGPHRMSVAEISGQSSWQAPLREASASEPLLKCRKRMMGDFRADCRGGIGPT